MHDEKISMAVNKMMRISRIHRKLIEQGVSDIGLARTAHRALMYLSKKEKLPSQKELAAHLEITPAAVTGILQRLEVDGYIERTLGSDNRYNEIGITEKGRSTVARSRVIFKEIDAKLFDGFTPDEIDVYAAFLARIKENAEKCLPCDTVK